MNLDKLEVALQRDPSQVTVDELNEWYEQFLAHEITGDEPSEDLNLIYRGLKWVMQYEHTNAEELRELAEQQAIENAEKEENWELERENLMEQISELRENITSKAGVDMTSEAFRAEIDSLRAENSHLKQINRERDIELADQREKMEEYLGRIGVLENERRNLTNAQIQLEDANKELTRRISRMTEDIPIGDRSESRMLRQRHEQAIELSNQLRSVIAQNEELEKRAESLSQNLEEATVLIKEANSKNETLREQLDKANNTLDKVAEENVNMKRILDGKDEQLFASKKSTEMTEKQWEDLVRQKDIQLHRLRENIKKYETEITDLRTKIQSDYTLEREQELEKLRVELVEATNLARQLFGERSQDQDGTKVDATSQIRNRMVHINKELTECREQLKKEESERKSLEKQLENKDTALAKAHGDLARLRQQLFGSTDEFVRDLERQLEFRDRQIAQLTVKCSLLQLELEKEEEQDAQRSEKPLSPTSPHDHSRSKPPKPPKQRKSRPKSASREGPKTAAERPKSPADLERRTDKEPEDIGHEDLPDSPASSSSSRSFDWDEEKNRLVKELKEKRTKEALEFIERISEEVNTTVPFDAIAPLYNELRKAHEKLKDKDSINDQLQESIKSTRMTILTLKTDLSKAKKELEDFKEQILGSEWQNPNDSEFRKEFEALRVANIELQNLADSVRINGSDLERRFEESARRLIHLGIENSRLERQLKNEKKLREVISTQYQSAQLRLTGMSSENSKNLRSLVKENEQNVLEIARLHNIVFHSVPMKTYDGLLKKYKNLLHNYTVTMLGKSEAEADAGYESEIDDRNFDISLAPALTADTSPEELISENKTLRETTEILEKQLQYWQRKNDEKREEIDHLQSFVDELKKETDLKSLLANMQDRFLLALREKNDGIEEQMANERDLRKLAKELNSTKKLWKLDRQRLVEVVLALQFNIEKLRARTAKSLTVTQLHALAELFREMKDKLTYLDTRNHELEVKEIETEASRTSYEAKRESIEELLEYNMDLERAQVRMANVLTQFNLLKAEQSRGEAKIKQLEEVVRQKDEELSDLKAELNEVEMMKIDLRPLQELPKHLETKSPESTNRSEKPSNPVDDLSSRSSSSSTTSSSENAGKVLRNLPKPVIVDNSKQYEVEIERLKEAARVSIESLQTQLSQKDKTIEEYKELLEKLSIEANQHHESPQAVFEEEHQQFLTRLSSYDSNEDANRELIALKWEKRELEEINRNLAERLRESQEAMGKRRESRERLESGKESQEVGVQANVKRRSR
uniref:Centrosomal protein n=2 Tax=Bursaphelenchus xylophilus TaxID=6326 RepID=A0A1I7S1H9_BURXY